MLGGLQLLAAGCWSLEPWQPLGLTAHDEAAQVAAFEADAFGAVCRGMASEMVGEPEGSCGTCGAEPGNHWSGEFGSEE